MTQVSRKSLLWSKAHKGSQIRTCRSKCAPTSLSCVALIPRLERCSCARAFRVSCRGRISIRINHDGSIILDTTWVEADSFVLKKPELVEASMSADGVELKRRTPDSIAAVSKDSVIAKAR